ncbi:uncharacterized protein LOC108040499 isoform X2 [Drosophila rhopaloa]|uniref:Uncharacterized protein LOC108040499 isoform X2 n=1 Tax=Drosophila rhopaloa TaxID=1041015 RepID=A0A6P4E620_DRORH|nr:uncharacterized protein LOC108040499 isoform X2 [Drosophila rhopaloa]
MHQVWAINDLLCHFMRRYLHMMTPHCQYYSIWKFPTGSPGVRVKDFLKDLSVSSCDEMFPFMFFYVFAISVLGVLHNLIEFMHIFAKRKGIHVLRMWRPRDILMFSDGQLRRFRLVGNFFMIVAWSLLLYALVKPQFIDPWVMVSATATSIDGFFLFLDVLRRRRMCGLRSLLLLSITLINAFCVQCVKASLERIIHQNAQRNLVWWR